MENGTEAKRPPLAEILPPLILGTATFNHQYHSDPTSMPCLPIVARALAHGLTAFDTSPYYGPSEILLGRALAALHDPSPSQSPSTSPTRQTSTPLHRSDYLLITKAGRIGPRKFDYSDAWIRHSVARSCRRLGSPYLDLVYLHDVEFVSAAEVLGAVKTLRELRAAGVVRYVGISGFTLSVLTSLALQVLEETGEPLDAVMNYCHCDIQNTTLTGQNVLDEFKKAGVGVVLNASVLGMGMLTSRGVDEGPQAAWHPSPAGLRRVVKKVGERCQEVGERVEAVAIRYALDTWARKGGESGFGVKAVLKGSGEAVVGATVIGVTGVDELEETVEQWTGERGVLRAIIEEKRHEAVNGASVCVGDKKTPEVRHEQPRSFVEDELWGILGEWKDYEWSSPEEGYVNEVSPEEMGRITAGDSD